MNLRVVPWSIAALMLVTCASTPSSVAHAEQSSGTRRTPVTPRTRVPAFSGIWIPTPKRGTLGFGRLDPATGNLALGLNSRGGAVEFERDAGLRMRVFPREQRPWYKPQYWERVRYSDVHGYTALAPDPNFQCLPDGVPRIGMPDEIVQTDREMWFIYPLHLRRIYIDGRDHPPEDQWIGTWFGHSVGRWEGDTLVISTVDFNGLEWLGWPGWITSPDKRVIERIRRVGNTLNWEAEVNDSLLLRPWKAAPQTRQLNTDPSAEIEEALPCLERDLQHMVTRERG